MNTTFTFKFSFSRFNAPTNSPPLMTFVTVDFAGNVKYDEDKANIKLTDHQLVICQNSKKKTILEVSKKVSGPYMDNELNHISDAKIPEKFDQKNF
ncbi:hypothetical protein YC2023_017965 [Brassica napus]